MKKYRKNDFVVTEPFDLLGNGNAVARDEDGFVFFIRGGVPGDKLRVKIIKVTKSYAVAIIDEILKKSAVRIDSKCPVSQKCGGCVFQNINYESECEFKRKMIDDDLERIGKTDLRVSKFIPAENTCNYRNKVIYPVTSDAAGRMISGFYSQNSHRVCQHDICRIGSKKFSKVRDFVVSYCNENGVSAYDERTGEGTLRHIYIRESQKGEFVLTLIVNSKKFISDMAEFDFAGKFLSQFSECVGIIANINTDSTNAVLGDKWRKIYGSEYIEDTLLGKSFRISAASFYQVNRAQAERLYSEAQRLADIKEGDTLLDLYCGTGTIGICVAKDGCKLYGVDIVPQAIIDAEYNAKRNGINAEFICLDAGEALNSDRIKKLSPDVIIIDPPRKGCGEEAVRRISSFSAEKIVYISCDPATLARDIVTFAECGYTAVEAVGVDLFARTGHVETVALLSQLKPDDIIQVELNSEDLALTSTEAKATYEEIKTFVKRVFGFKVSSLYIAQVKRKYGIEVGQNYNLSKKGSRVPICPQEKENAIVEALRYFKMIK